jgi:hypothetical protein
MAIGPLPSCPAIPIFAGFLLASLTVLGGNDEESFIINLLLDQLGNDLT